MIKHNLRRISFVFLIILLTPLLANAQGKFSNAITDIDLNQASEGIVKVNIYTKNPYSEKVIINKKPDNKYVILLPETDNWMNTKPSTVTVGESIKNIDMKTQANNASSGKGYTKIVIESKKPVEIIPQTLVVKSKQIQEPIAKTNTKIFEKATPFTPETIAYNKQVANVAPSTQKQPTKKPIIRPAAKTFVPKNVPVEIIDLPQPKNVMDSEYSDSFLLVPTTEEIKKQPKQDIAAPVEVDASKLSKALMKDTPKQLTLTSKFQFKLFKNKKLSFKKLISLEFNLKLLKFTFKALLILVPIGLLGYFLYSIYGKKDKKEKLLAEEENASNIENEELKKAIEEFNLVEKNVEKLEPKPYVKDIDSYRNLNGFKKEEMPEDILKTLDAIERNKRLNNPLFIIGEDNKMVSYNYSNDKYLLKNPLEDLTEDEEKALFEEDETTNEEDETLSSKYYNNAEDIFIVEDEDSAKKDEIFIIEDDEDLSEEDENVLDEIEANEIETKEEAEIESDPESEPEPSVDVENLKIKVRFELSDDKGIALLKYHDVTALIGYIGSEISLLKKFDNEIVPEELSVRLSEQVDENTQHYIVKVGNYKGLVEVKPLTIRLLLNL